jgi:hypothetical protein
MATRVQKAQRMLKVLEQLHRIEEFKKIELQRRLTELETSQHEVILSLNTDDALHGLFIDTTAKFLQSLAKEAQQVAVAKEAQSERLLRQATKMKSAERLHETLHREKRRVEAESELLETIERVARPGGTSPP